jgi:hypothetical protein
MELVTKAALEGSASWPSATTPKERDQLSRIYRRSHKADPENLEIERIVQQLDRGKLAGDDLDDLLLTNLKLIFDIFDKE